jgi:hypothetical protein
MEYCAEATKNKKQLTSRSGMRMMLTIQNIEIAKKKLPHPQG